MGSKTIDQGRRGLYSFPKWAFIYQKRINELIRNMSGERKEMKKPILVERMGPNFREN